MRGIGMIVLVVVLLGGCADGESSSTTGDAASDSDGAPAAAGECRYLATSDLVEALGADAELTAAGLGSCSFTLDGWSVEVIRVEGADIRTAARERCAEGSLVEVPDVGDEAFACQTYAPFALAVDGEVEMTLTAVGPEDPDAVVDAFAQVLPAVDFR